MGLDLVLRAIPDDDSFEAWTGRFPEDLENLQFLSMYYSGERGTEARDSESDRELRRIAVDIQRRHPGISERVLWLERDWDVLRYVFSPGHRSGDGPGDDPGTLAVRGMREYHPGLRGTQGIPIRYLPSGEVPGVLAFLTSVTRDDVVAALREAENPATQLYKFFHEHAATWLDTVLEHHRRMIQFYREVLEHREAVWFIKD